MADPIRLGLVGLGKIARDQHIPAVAGSSAFTLVGTASPDDGLKTVSAFASLSELISAGGVDAVAICTPPSVRHALACEAIEAGLHVMLEKPPTATLCEARDLIARAALKGTTLFGAWHSREAAGVVGAKAWLAGKAIDSIEIAWKEDIRRWHPAQEWILGPGGFGVFDPAINALSILTAIVPGAITVEESLLTIPDGRAAPITGRVKMHHAGGARIDMDLDFFETGEQIWTITVISPCGSLVLSNGGAELSVDGCEISGDDREYSRLYARFADLIASGESDVDLQPLELVADAYLVADFRRGEPFEFRVSDVVIG